MDGQNIKMILMQIMIVLIVALFIWSWFTNRKKINNQNKKEDLDVNIKDDSFWEKRFNGLKADYEDREVYHQQRYDNIKSEYESRIQYLRTMIDESRQDYLNLRDTLIEMQSNNTEITAKLQQANKLLVEYESKCNNLEHKIKSIESQIQ